MKKTLYKNFILKSDKKEKLHKLDNKAKSKLKIYQIKFKKIYLKYTSKFTKKQIYVL